MEEDHHDGLEAAALGNALVGTAESLRHGDGLALPEGDGAREESLEVLVNVFAG